MSTQVRSLYSIAFHYHVVLDLGLISSAKAAINANIFFSYTNICVNLYPILHTKHYGDFKRF